MIYLWSGTCDLTVKDKSTGSLTLRFKEIEDGKKHYEEQVSKILSLTSTYSRIQLCLMHVPTYSIESWTIYKETGGDKKTAHQDDEILARQVKEINNFISAFNKDGGFMYSILHFVVMNNRKTKNRTEQLTPALYRDGIHTRNLLAGVWIRRRMERIQRDCYELK